MYRIIIKKLVNIDKRNLCNSHIIYRRSLYCIYISKYIRTSYSHIDVCLYIQAYIWMCVYCNIPACNTEMLSHNTMHKFLVLEWYTLDILHFSVPYLVQSVICTVDQNSRHDPRSVFPLPSHASPHHSTITTSLNNHHITQPSPHH